MQKYAQFKLLRQSFSKAQQRMTLQANKHSTDRNFQIGDMVFIKLHPCSQYSVVAREFPKLATRYYGPYKIINKFGKCAYKVDLPANSDIHSVFHVSLLKVALTIEQEALAILSSFSSSNFMVEAFGNLD